MAKNASKLINAKTIGYTIYIAIVMVLFFYAGQLFTQFEPQPQSLLADDSAPITVTADGVNIRSEANLDSDVVYHADNGEQLTLLGYDYFFYHVQAQDGTEGYAANWLVDSESTQLEDFARLAQEHLVLNDPPTIVIDPGHGGEDPGAISGDNLYEKEIALQTSHYLADKLDSIGVNTLMTREDDSFVDLKDRTVIANEADADLFFSIHYDSSETASDSGTTTYYYDEEQSYGLGELMNPYLMEYLPLSNNGVRFGDYQVIRETTMPGLLFELGYMSNDGDVAAFSQDEYQKTAAQAIFDALVTQMWVDYYPTVPASYQKLATGMIIILFITSLMFYAYQYIQHRLTPN